MRYVIFKNFYLFKFVHVSTLYEYEYPPKFIIKIIDLLDIIHRPVIFIKNDVSEIEISSVDWAQQSKF
jgi:hypothetical protein